MTRFCQHESRLHPSLARDQDLGRRRLPDELCVESTARTGYKTGFRVVALSDCATTRSEEEQHFTFDKNLPTFANVKLDRTGRYLAVMEVRAERCRKEAARYAARAKPAQNKIDRTKAMVLCYLESHDLKQFETEDTTLRRQKNSQDSVVVSNPDASHRISSVTS